ncbi:MAG: EamA family transporter, partial [Muricomes sp.]
MNCPDCPMKNTKRGAVLQRNSSQQWMGIQGWLLCENSLFTFFWFCFMILRLKNMDAEGVTMNNMNIFYFFPLVLVVFSNVFYHIMSKRISPSLNPFLGLMITYGIALCVSIVLFLMTKKESLMTEMREANLSNFLLGAIVLGLEGGYMIMYRNGWEISKGSLVSNICVAVILMVIGLLFYKESISLRKMIGAAFCILGVFIIGAVRILSCFPINLSNT